MNASYFISKLHVIAVCVIAFIIFPCAAQAQEVAERVDDEQIAKGFSFFAEKVEPILRKRCYPCHSHESMKAKGGLVLDSRAGWQNGGSSGPVVTPGKPSESSLISAIHHDGLEMPPDDKLPSDEIELLEKWVAMGAPDPRANHVEKPEAENLWSLRPITQPDLPKVRQSDWPIDAIDHFILSELESAGLQPAPDADRSTLLRRVSIDLTGLPPTPDEIESFLRDQSNVAYEKVVDRLLASKAFGEHWARYWFDLSCYADLADIQGNVLIRDAWRYRDYVIQSFNSDKPFDQFTREQIAGDLMPYANVEQRREQLIATGYLAIGPWTLQNYIKKQLDADVVDHQIDRIGRTFLGQTLACARCHDHKFDPIPTRDYYALAGILHSTLTTRYDGPGVWSRITQIQLPESDANASGRLERQQEIAHLTEQREALQNQVANLLPLLPGATDANALVLEKGIPANQSGKTYQVLFAASPTVWAMASQATADSDGLQVSILRTNGTVLASFRHKPGSWTNPASRENFGEIGFSYVGDGTGDVKVHLGSAMPGNGRFAGAIDDLRIQCDRVELLNENFANMQPGSTVGKQADTQRPVYAGVALSGWRGEGINHNHAVQRGEGNLALQIYSGSNFSLASAKPTSEQEKLAHAQATELEATLQRINGRIQELEAANAPEFALAVRDIDAPADSPIYKRGDFQSLGPPVSRGFIHAIATTNAKVIPQNSSGRWELSQWLTDTGNPLASRVLVNRIWSQLFGQGIVRTVDYFGTQGETPSHPELLDFLANRFRFKDQWSFKRTIRRFVLSRSYRMSSTLNPEAMSHDPDNRLLWRMPARRLTAETLRDGMLLASGQLDFASGGPSLGLELPGNISGLGDQVNPPTWVGQVASYIQNRRTIFQPLRRERPSGDLEILSTFDFPHPSEITGERTETTVATQALFLLNSPFVKKQAQALALRLAREEADEEARVRRLYLLTASRPAEADEVSAALKFLDACEPGFGPSAGTESSRSQAWIQLCHAVLGSNNFLFRE